MSTTVGIAYEWMTVEPEDASETLFGHLVSSLQTGVEIEGGKATGTLKYVSTGSLPDWWGAGNFLALKFGDVPTGATSKKVGLRPSAGSGLVELDEDMNGVFKVGSKAQDIIAECKVDNKTIRTVIDLTGMTLETEA